jgi:hypothetical protein
VSATPTVAVRGLCALLLASAALLLGAGPASAVVRYAASGGTAEDTVCVTPQASPCSIDIAASGPNVQPDDEVVIAPGDYSDTAGDLGEFDFVSPIAGNVHGAIGQPRPTITLHANSGWGAFLISTGRLSHLVIETADAQVNVTVQGGTVEDLIARSSTAGARVCQHTVSDTATIRDSVCLSTGENSAAVGTNVGTFVGTHTGILRNVTAIATGNGSYGLHYRVHGGAPGVVWNVDAKSVIARGEAADVRADGVGAAGAATTVALDHSNYASTETETAAGGSATVTPAGTNFNVTDPPLLAADSIHQLPGSPTIDAGDVDGSSGATDIDGQTRTIDSAADAGADELAHSTSTAVSCSPGSVALGASATCTATVTDTAATATAPPGSVGFSSDAAGSFGSGGTCALVAVSAAESSCQLPYAPAQLGSGSHEITARFPLGGVHEASEGSTTLAVTPLRRCAGKPVTIPGTPGANVIRGTRKADVIAGLGGRDTIRGLGGKDLICGGAGNDRLLGGSGRDRLIGGRGRDRLVGGPGRDRLLGGPGRDRLIGGRGRDILLGGPGRDRQVQ